MEDRRKDYRFWDPIQGRHEAICPEEVLSPNDLVFFLLDTVPQLDLSAFHNYYAGELRGQPPFDVTMMVTLVVYSYSVGVVSSRKIAAACERNLAFRAIVGHDRPDFRTLSDFRKHHRAAFRPLFIEVLRLAGELGMVRLGNLATDGTKIKANASRHKGFDYSYNSQAVVDEAHQLIVAAEVTSAANDKQQAVGELETEGFDPHIATGRQKHPTTESSVTEADATKATTLSVKEQRSQKLRSAPGKQIYAARKAIVEPVFGQIKQARGLRQYLLRGIAKVSAEWQLICLTHNLLKIWRFTSSPP